MPEERSQTDLLDLCGVRVRDLSSAYGSTRVLHDVDLDVAPGEIVALLGPSGCGKTTLLRSIAGLETPQTGTVTIGDVVVHGDRVVPPQRRRVGMVFQDGALFPHLKVIDNVAYGLPRVARGRGTSRVAHDLLEMVGLADKAQRQPGMLSGGEQQRVALARALAPNPAVMLLDEPFSSLDAALRVQLRTEVRALLKRIGVTSILVTHDQQEALMFGDRIAVMRAGRIEQIGTPAEVYMRPATPWVARFVGDANIIRGTAVAGTVHTALGALASGSEVVGERLVLCRPERLELRSGGEAKVRSTSYAGQQTHYVVELDSGETVATCSFGAPDHLPGEPVTVRLLDAELHTWPADQASVE